MIRVYVKKQSNYPIKAKDVKKTLNDYFSSHGMVSESVVSVAFVSEKKMLDIGKKYLKDSIVHNVLSFLPNEVEREFVYPPNGEIDLGEIIVCFPKVVEEAKREGKTIDVKVKQLLEHGAEHLMGIHHD